MNKRIQELAEQARASVPPGLVVEEWIKVYNQVLGELIVRKCAEIAQREDHDPADCVLSYFNLLAGADHMAGDGGYSEGTREAYEEFVKKRNYPL
jgi:hypothetical protein